MKLPTIREAGDLRGKRVLLRVDFNVPIDNGVVVDDFRIQEALPTIRFLREAGAHVIIISHLHNRENDSLKPVAKYLQQLMPVSFIGDLDFFHLEGKLAGVAEGECALLENLRHAREEESNNEQFAKNLANLADIYVNEAFSVSHREHASIVGIPKLLPTFVGLRFEKELEELSKALTPAHPFLFILGGAKFETKEPLIDKFLSIADLVFVGGALANDFFQAQGYEVGVSDLSKKALPVNAPIFGNTKLLLPLDVVVRTAEGARKTVKPTEVEKTDKILDAGPQTIAMLKDKMKTAKLVLWNGPLGDYEQGFVESTEGLAYAMTDSKAYTIAGGGDTMASFKKLNIRNKFSFVSTGGGAMLYFLTHETLPGIEAIRNGKK
jgi:phosphoglycerate kinase